jgi:hypothetical protein
VDEELFRMFLEDQRTHLLELDALLRIPQTGISEKMASRPRDTSSFLLHDKSFQTRFDDACRRLADAYAACDDRQRQILRDSLREIGGVAASMAVPPEDIRVKIDGVRFRLALIYESIKDLCPDANEAMRRLERLRQAAVDAGIDPNPYLREVAAMSSDVRHSRRSMRESLLFLLIDAPSNCCRNCGNPPSPGLAKCPHCGVSNPDFIETIPVSVGTEGQTGAEYSNIETVRYLPTGRLIGYAMLCVSLLILVIMTFCQISSTFIYEGYHLTRGAWSCKATILILFVVVAYFKDSLIPMMKTLFSDRPRLGVTWTQGLLLAGIALASFAAIVTFLSIFDRDLGW